MSEEQLIFNVKMWLVLDEEGKCSKVRYKYMLPEIKHEFHADMYRVFFETLCGEIAKKENSAEIYRLLMEGMDDSSE